MGYIVGIATLAAHAAAVILLSRQWGPLQGTIFYGAIATLLTCAAGILLLNIRDDNVTWKNHISGVLLPWLTFVGGGPLYAVLIKNALASFVFGSGVAVAYHWNLFDILGPKPAHAAGQWGWMEAILYWLTLACWVVMLGAWLWMLRSLSRHQTGILSTLLRRRSLWIPLLLPPITTGVSIALRLSGQTWPALLLVGIPLLIFLSPVLLMTAVILAHQLSGKPMRWN